MKISTLGKKPSYNIIILKLVYFILHSNYCFHRQTGGQGNRLYPLHKKYVRSKHWQIDLTVADSPGLKVVLDTPTNCLMGAVTPVGQEMYTCTTCKSHNTVVTLLPCVWSTRGRVIGLSVRMSVCSFVCLFVCLYAAQKWGIWAK